MKLDFKHFFIVTTVFIAVIIFSTCKNNKKSMEDENLTQQSGDMTTYIIQNLSDEDIQTIERIKKRINYGYGGVSFGKEPGTFTFYYYDEDGRTKRVLAPAAFVPEKEEVLYEKYPFLIKGDYMYSAQFSSTNDFSAMAFKEKEKDNILTVFFTTDQWKTWATSYIKIEDDYMADVDIKTEYVYLTDSDFSFPRFHIYCPNSTTGYLKICPRDKTGGRLYRTENSGVSWEFICELPDHEKDLFFAQVGEIFLRGEKDKFFCLYKSDDFVNWTEQDFPIDTEKYEKGHIMNARLEGEYGVVKAALFYKEAREDGKSYKEVFYATRDGGKNWLFWQEKES